MEHAVHASSVVAYHTHDDFLIRFRRNLVKETKVALYWLSFVLYVIPSALLYGVLKWLFEFDDVKGFFGVIVPPLFVYLFGQYLTLIPTFFVLVLVLVPLKHSRGILMLAMVISFFAVFLI